MVAVVAVSAYGVRMASTAPSPFEFKLTPASRRALKAVDREHLAGVNVVLADGQSVALPGDLAAVLLTAVRVAADGHDVSLLSRDDEVSPAKAGEMLGFSRQYVDRLISEGVLAARRLPGSTHRKVRVADVLDLAEVRTGRQRRITDMVDALTADGAEY